MTDVDIDFPDRNAALSLLTHVKASRLDKGNLVPHNTGVYFQAIPANPISNLSNVEYKAAEERGYFKIDFLNVHVYSKIQDEAHLNRLVDTEPIWELLSEEEVCNQLIHVNGYHQLLRDLKPKSVEDLAMVLALMRPGKKHLINKCITDGFDSIASEIWETTDTSAYTFKKSHSVSYAMLVIVNLNLVCEQMLEQQSLVYSSN